MKRPSNKAYDLSTYTFCKDEPILCDTNVWLYLYPPPARPKRKLTRQYSKAVARMLREGAHLMMDALVLSEYLNAYCRLEWMARYQNTYPDFKRFRKSPQFRTPSSAAVSFAGQILATTKAENHPFCSANLVEVLADFKKGRCDINDGLLTETCRVNQWKFVTHDADFQFGGIEVLTTNPTLLRACP